MNEREIAEIRRRIRPQKNNIGRIRGCYVNDNHTIISEIDQMLGMISDNESEEILSMLRKTLVGQIGRNLLDITFSNQQVLESEEHKLLSGLRDSSLSDTKSVNKIFEKIIDNLDLPGSYFIILANDKYDVISYSEDGEKNDSSDVFSYILCAVCPVKNAKPSLGYSLSEGKFKNVLRDSIIAAPEVGFMFPAFDTRKANIYNALFYARNASVSYETLANSLFGFSLPMPATEQTENVAKLLTKTIAEDCDIEFVQSIQGQLLEITNDHKNNKEEEPLLLSKKDVNAVLRSGGISENSINAFSESFESDFGSNAAMPPANIIDIKKFEVRTPEVTVKVKPEHSELISTRIIDGTKYILIRADGEVEVNGIQININD